MAIRLGFAGCATCAAQVRSLSGTAFCHPTSLNRRLVGCRSRVSRRLGRQRRKLSGHVQRIPWRPDVMPRCPPATATGSQPARSPASTPHTLCAFLFGAQSGRALFSCAHNGGAVRQCPDSRCAGRLLLDAIGAGPRAFALHAWGGVAAVRPLLSWQPFFLWALWSPLRPTWPLPCSVVPPQGTCGLFSRTCVCHTFVLDLLIGRWRPGSTGGLTLVLLFSSEIVSPVPHIGFLTHRSDFDSYLW